jgi:hypothetical protein
MYLVETLFKFQKERELECVWCCLLDNFRSSYKIKGKVKNFEITRVTCRSQGLLVEIMSRHF